MSNKTNKAIQSSLLTLILFFSGTVVDNGPIIIIQSLINVHFTCEFTAKIFQY